MQTMTRVSVAFAAFLTLSTVALSGRAQPVPFGPEPYLDLVRARAVADGAVLAGTDGLHRVLHRSMKTWGAQGRDAAGYGYVEVLGKSATMNLTTDGDEETVAVTARAVGKARTVLAVFDKTPLGELALDGTWRRFELPLGTKQRAAGVHKLELREKKAGAALAEAAPGVSPKATVLVHDVHLLLRAARAGGVAAAGPRDEAGTLWLRPGERARYYVPFAEGSLLQVAGVVRRGAAGSVRVELQHEDGTKAAVATLADAGGAFALPGVGPEHVTRLDVVAEGDADGEVGLQGIVVSALPNPLPANLPEWRPPKNIIIWIIDTLRADRLSHVNPDSPVKTPNMDAFAAEGTTFTAAYVQGNFSKETGCSVFTSTYNDLHRCHSMQRSLPKDIPVPQELFRKAGYRTGGLISNGFLCSRWGYVRSWDTWRNYICEKGRIRYPEFGADLDWGGGRVRGVMGEAMTRDATEWIGAQQGNPFYLYFHTVDPHTPYRPPRQFWEPFVPFKLGKTLPLDPNDTGAWADGYNGGKRTFTKQQWELFVALYLGEVAYTDFYFGKMIEALRKRGTLDETMIIVTADHGEGFLDHGTVGHGILNLYDEVIRVPFIVRYPGGVPAGRRVETPVEQMDAAPTVVDASGLTIPKEWQGGSLMPLLRGREPLLAPPTFSTMSDFLVVARAGRYKLQRFRDRDRAPEVYDIKADPGEKKDLAKDRPMLTRYLRGYTDWFERVATTWKRHERGALGDFRPAATLPGQRATAPAP